MKQMILIAGLIFLGSAQTACSVKAKSDDLPAPAQTKAVNGPDLSGNWTSGCQKSNFGEFKSIDAVFTTATVSRKSTTYSDASCATAIDTKDQSGPYHFIQANKDGSFTIEYTFPAGKANYIVPEKVLLDNGVLYLSDFALGDAITKDNMIPLHKAPASR